MVGRVKTLLYSDTFLGGVSEIGVKISDASGEERLAWVSTSKVRAGDKLEKNALLILKYYLDPLVNLIGIPLPRFEISFQKTQTFMYHSHEQLVGDTSAGAALLIAMVSAMLRLPTADSVAVTGAIEPPHDRIHEVRGLREKVKAAVDAELETILVPAGNLAGSVDKSLLQEVRLRARMTDGIVSSTVHEIEAIDDVWEHVFPAELIFEQVLSNVEVYRACSRLSSWQSPASGLVSYLKGICESRWKILRKTCQEGGAAGFRKVFPSIVDFYTKNAVNPGDIVDNLREVLTLPQLSEEESLFRQDDWYALSKLFRAGQNDEALKLLLLTRKSSLRYAGARSDFRWTDESIRGGVLEALAYMTSSGDLREFLYALSLLLEKLDGDQPDLNLRNDLRSLVEIQFLDAKAMIEKWADKLARVLPEGGGNLSNSPVHGLQTQVEIFNDFVRRIGDALRVIEYLIGRDPELAAQLRQHDSILAIEDFLKQAAKQVDTPDMSSEELVGKARTITEKLRAPDLAQKQQSKAKRMFSIESLFSRLEFVKNAIAMRKFPGIYGVGVSDGTFEDRRNSLLIRDMVTWYEPVLNDLETETRNKLENHFQKYHEKTVGMLFEEVEAARWVLNARKGICSEEEKSNASATIAKYDGLLEIMATLDEYLMEKVREEAVELVRVADLTRFSSSLSDSRGDN